MNMEKVVIDYPFLLGFDLSNANGYAEYQEFMDGVMSGKVVLNGIAERVLRRE